MRPRPRRLVLAALVAAGVAVVVAGCSMTSSSPPLPDEDGVSSELLYPRVATYYLAGRVGDAARAVMAHSDLVIVDAEAAALDRASLEALRHARPDLLLLARLTSEELHREVAAERPLANARFARVPPHAWVTEPGATLTTAIDAVTTRLRVANPAAFALHHPPSPHYPADEPVYLLVDGEHVRLVAIDGDALVVERGHRSAPVAHAAGARVATHVVRTAGTWMLDLAANAPRVDGRTWRETLVDEAAAMIAHGPWDGLLLDVCLDDIAWLNDGLLDLDRDGRADDPAASSRQWSTGMGMLVDALRARLGPDVPIVANPGTRDCPHAGLDGILLEGWPTGTPATELPFAVGLDRYAAWTARGRGLTIANGFSLDAATAPDAPARTDYATMRFGLAVALLDDGYFTFDNGTSGHDVTWWYDELDGAGRGPRWLGRARGAAAARGALRWREFEHGLAVVNLGDAPAAFAAPPGFARLAGAQDPAHNDGAPVDGELVIAPRDAYVLVRR